MKALKKALIIGLALSLFLVSDVSTTSVNAAKKTTAKASKSNFKISLKGSTSKLTRKSVVIKVNATDKSGIKYLYFKKGKIKTSSQSKWRKATNITKKKKFTATQNGWYTVCAVNKKGKRKVASIEVKNIDKTLPIVKSSYSVANKIATISVSTSDKSGITSIRWGRGSIPDNNSKSYPNVVKNGKFQVKDNGYYTIRVSDKVGNITRHYVFVTITYPLCNMEVFQGSSPKSFSSGKDWLGNSWSNVVESYYYWADETRTFEYHLNGKYNFFEGELYYSKNGKTDGSIQIQILADDTLIYTSQDINNKTNPIKFNVVLNKCRFLTIKCVYSDCGVVGFGNTFFYN